MEATSAADVSPPPRRKRKWHDYIPGKDDKPDDMQPVCIIHEGRGANYNFHTTAYDRVRPTDDELIAWIRDYINDPALGKVEVRDFVGRDYIAMQWKDEKYFWKATEALFRRGIAVNTQCRLTGCWFDPMLMDPLPVSGFTMEYLEKSMAKKYKAKLSESRFSYLPNEVVFTHESSWSTPHGKDLVRFVRQGLKKRSVDECSSSDEETTYPPTHGLPMDTPEPPAKKARLEEPPSTAVVVPEPAVSAESDTRDDCCICLVNKANTLVMPCGHSIVCSECSDQLKKTPNAKLCVLCRGEISEVLQ